MVELQSCATLVNASALCVIEQEVKEDSANVVAEISAELESERQKNKELMERILMLEAQIRERNMETQEKHQHSVTRSLKKFKKQKIEQVADEEEKNNTVKCQMVSQNKPDTEGIVLKEINPENRLINWMSMDDGQTLDQEKFKDSESVPDFKETNSDDECDDHYADDDDIGSQRPEEIDGKTEAVNAHKGYLNDHIHDRSNIASMERFSDHGSDPAGIVKQEDHKDQKTSCILAPLSEKIEVKTRGKEIKEIAAFTVPFEVPSSGSMHKSQNRKHLKVAFCPKEVNKIMESEALLQKNGQSHTLRKIIVFASLGIRHGFEDMYELDFSHFSILKKGEPYVSPTSPGEHVLYENPGVRRKLFYPNRQNPVLCPVQILEEEKAMRPSDPSCPSCFFLCIKYGGRTRNLPQNEYVRQRMGRNKLKSFGPLMCQMAMLVHIRSGSFFFKALAITLLFMAGFPDDLVQSETKYRNLDLLHKYYRTDEDAEGEQLFLPLPIACDNGTQNPQSLTKKSLPAKSRGRKQTNAVTKSHYSQKTPCQQSQPINSSPTTTQFGLSGYSTSHTDTYAMAAFHSFPSQIPIDNCHMPNAALGPPITNVTAGNHHSSYGMVPPPQAASTFVPVMYWPPPNAFLHGPYHPSTYGYHFPSTANYMSFHTQPYHNNHPTCSSSWPKLLEGSGKNDLAASQESDSHSDSRSSEGTEQKQ